MRVLSQLVPEPRPEAGCPASEASAASDDADNGPAPADAVGAGAADVPIGTVGVAHWRSRREAYATLEALADYLGEVEPHSPTPFLIRRAANWERMSLPEVIAEIISQEGGVSRLFQILGIKL